VQLGKHDGCASCLQIRRALPNCSTRPAPGGASPFTTAYDRHRIETVVHRGVRAGLYQLSSSRTACDTVQPPPEEVRAVRVRQYDCSVNRLSDKPNSYTTRDVLAALSISRNLVNCYTRTARRDVWAFWFGCMDLSEYFYIQNVKK